MLVSVTLSVAITFSSRLPMFWSKEPKPWSGTYAHARNCVHGLVRGEHRLASSASRGEGARKAELGRPAVDTVVGVQVLNHNNLEAGGTALARGNDGPGQEELPNSVPALAVLGIDNLLVAEPVAVPTPESTRVVYTDGIDTKNIVRNKDSIAVASGLVKLTS